MFVIQACDNSKLLQTHLIGALIHGRRTVAYIDILQWPHDSNLTLNCLLEGLVRASNDGRLPPKLYIQLDNCGRENKNRYFLGMVAILVKRQIVSEATMGFLMVGHTHEGKINIICKQIIIC